MLYKQQATSNARTWGGKGLVRTAGLMPPARSIAWNLRISSCSLDGREDPDRRQLRSTSPKEREVEGSPMSI